MSFCNFGLGNHLYIHLPFGSLKLGQFNLFKLSHIWWQLVASFYRLQHNYIFFTFFCQIFLNVMNIFPSLNASFWSHIRLDIFLISPCLGCYAIPKQCDSHRDVNPGKPLPPNIHHKLYQKSEKFTYPGPISPTLLVIFKLSRSWGWPKALSHL